MLKKFSLLLVGLILVLLGPRAGLAGGRTPFTAEQQAVAAAARHYLEAEVKRDYKTVFRSLYPASEYRKANDFAAYLAEARSTPVGIESFKVLEVNGFARVEVDVVIRFADTGRKSLVNYSFPFVRSGGRWYKL
jgi:hypothetical protein